MSRFHYRLTRWGLWDEWWGVIMLSCAIATCGYNYRKRFVYFWRSTWRLLPSLKVFYFMSVDVDQLCIIRSASFSEFCNSRFAGSYFYLKVCDVMFIDILLPLLKNCLVWTLKSPYIYRASMICAPKIVFLKFNIQIFICCCKCSWTSMGCNNFL